MFDLGFAELVVIFVLGLIILGPKRMPLAVKFVAKSITKARNMLTSIQYEIDRELELEKLKETVNKTTADVKDSVAKLDPSGELKEVKEAVDDMKQSLSNDINDIKKVNNGSK